MGMSTCKDCGRRISDGASFCPGCGANEPAHREPFDMGGLVKTILVILGIAILMGLSNDLFHTRF